MSERSQPDLRFEGAQDGAVFPRPVLENLFQQILQQVDNHPTVNQFPDPVESSAEVVLEAFVDGVRYTLSRSCLPALQPQTRLSPREKEIIRLIASGLTNKSIAAILDVSPWTVATHLRRVFAKLAVNSRAEMISRVLEYGLLRTGE